jgi:hypothetical protein
MFEGLATAVAEARLTGAWDARRCWQLDGARSAQAWLRGICKVAAPTAARRVRVARALRAMPETMAAWASGDLNGDHVVELVRSRQCAPEAFARDEEVLVSQAAGLRYRHFEAALVRERLRRDLESLRAKQR